MDLVERYIEAFKFWLPKDTKEDIAAELREDVRSEIEEAERSRGRPLSEDEIAEILKARGSPLSAASRYLPQRALIGPQLFPLYFFVLKIVAVICFIPPVIGWVWAAFRPSAPWPGMFATPINSLLMSFAIVTLVFAVIEHMGINLARLEGFNPKALPSLTGQSSIRRRQSVSDIAGGMVVIGFVLAGYLSTATYTFPAGAGAANGHITFSSVWIPFWQIAVMIAAAKIALSAKNLLAPYWSVPRAILRLVLDVTTAAAFYWLMSSNLLREFVMPGADPGAFAQLARLSMWASALAAPIAGILMTIFVVQAGWRIAQTLKAHRAASPVLA